RTRAAPPAPPLPRRRSRRATTGAMAALEPLSSISFPKRAPSRKIGKNRARKPPDAPMNVFVQWASSGSPAVAATTSAAPGARTSTLQPRNDSQTRRPNPSRTPISPIPDTVSLKPRAARGNRPGSGPLRTKTHGIQSPLCYRLVQAKLPASMNTIVEFIQFALAPVFLLTGIAGFLGVLSTRLNSIVDRGRELEDRI